MKRIFTLLLIVLGFVGISQASVTVYTMTTADFQLVVDYSTAKGFNTSEFSTNTDSYFGASSYYTNFDFREGKWNSSATFTTWEDAVQTAVSEVVLPANFTAATTSDTINVYFKYYDGTSTKTDYFRFLCTKAAPSPEFAAYKSTSGSYKAEIMTFALAEQVTSATIDNSTRSIAIIVAAGTNVTALKPTITISDGATIDPASGAATNFTSPVSFNVTSEDASNIQVWTVTVTVMADVVTSIHDIQYVADPATSDASIYVKQTVTIQGVVTGFATFTGYNKYYIQEDGNPWTGIYVYDKVSGMIFSLGDKVKITGTVSEYYNVTEIETTKAEIISSRNTQPTPIVAPELNESLEGCLVTIEGVTLAVDDDATDYASALYLIATKGDKTFKINSELFNAFTPETGVSYNVTGVVAYLRSYFRVCPRSASDFTALVSNKEIAKATFNIYPNPAESSIYLTVSGSGNVKVRNIAGQIVAQYQVSNNKIDVSSLKKGVYFIESGSNVARFIKK
jgi:hypothetical protein